MSLSRRGLGGKYVGFGSSPGPAPRSNYQGGGGDVFSVMSEGFGRLSLVAASAANVVQTGTMEFTSKVKEGGLDHTVSETVNVVASKTTEIGQRTWGIMKGVMAIASQMVEEFTKEEASTWNQQNTNEGNGYYQNKGATTNMASKDPNHEQPPPLSIEIKATQDQFFGKCRFSSLHMITLRR
uniref:Senescence domain-containing protein n=1 Tax=Brassica campestris TaxID=3711 RepID=M4EDQ0_BRACM